MILVDRLSVSLSGNVIVKNASFTAQPGALTAILGPNGSGKTTCIKAISGERHYQGNILFNGRELRTLNAAELARERGVLTQSVNLGFNFKVREILEMGVIAGEVFSTEEAKRRISDALAAVDLSGFEDRDATSLSGGEQSRMHLARVLCQIWSPVHNDRARWLFLDEPVAALDIKHQLSIMALARDFARHGGGVLAVMHDLNLTAMFADSVVMMRGGEIAATGSPGEVFTQEILTKVYDCELQVERGQDARSIRVFPTEVAACA